MRRYWQRIDYSKIKRQEPHKPLEFQKTKFDDVPLSEFVFDNLPDDIIRMIFRRKTKLQNRVLFFEKNYIKIKKKLQKDSKKNKKIKIYRKFNIIYYLYFIYYNLDAMLYFFQLFFGYLGDKKFRKFVRKIASFKYFASFRLVLYNVLYYSISFPFRFFIYEKLYPYIRFVVHKRWLRFKQKMWFEIEDRTAQMRGNFWYDYNQKVSEQKKETFKTYFEMYTYPYTQYYKGWRKWVVRFRESGAFFIIEFQDLYAYFAGFSFVTWIVELYYVIYNIIFFFYPFVIPFIFYIPFFLFTKIFLSDYANNFNTILFCSFFFYMLFICLIFVLISIELTKYYLVKMSIEAVNWYSLDYIAKMVATSNCFVHFFFRTKFSKITLQRIRSRFFYYHDITRGNTLFDKNTRYAEEDIKRKDSFFCRKKLYPKISPRFWCQYGKCLYKKEVLGFGYVKNTFAGYSEFFKFNRKRFSKTKNLANKQVYTVFSFIFFKFYNFISFFFGFSKRIFFEIFVFYFIMIFFFFNFCSVLFLLPFSQILMYKSIYIFIFLFAVFFIIIFYAFKKYYIVVNYSCTILNFFQEKISNIILLFFFVNLFHIIFLSFYFLIYILF